MKTSAMVDGKMIKELKIGEGIKKSSEALRD
jgi:hypothetical protein